MKLTLKNLRSLKTNATPLEQCVYGYVIDEWGNYKDKTHIFTDVLYHGCQTGIVDFLIWYTDTVAFYRQYQSEINELLYTLMNETGLRSMKDLFGKSGTTKIPSPLNSTTKIC